MMLKAAELAPMPIASDSIATAVKPPFFRSTRETNTNSRFRISSDLAEHVRHGQTPSLTLHVLRHRAHGSQA
jgi:hypothetical protein